jgi:hypothetical protein
LASQGFRITLDGPPRHPEQLGDLVGTVTLNDVFT